MVLERSEHPFKDYKSRIALRARGVIRLAFEIRFTDLIFCISDYLIEFYKTGGAGKEKLFKVPSTVDTDRFVGSFERPMMRKYICYCGSLTILKDGVDILIKSYAEIAERFKDMDLILVGRADTMEDEKYFRDLVDSFGLKERIHFTGKLSRIKSPHILVMQSFSLLPVPKALWLMQVFPQRLQNTWQPEDLLLLLL